MRSGCLLLGELDGVQASYISENVYPGTRGLLETLVFVTDISVSDILDFFIVLVVDCFRHSRAAAALCAGLLLAASMCDVSQCRYAPFLDMWVLCPSGLFKMLALFMFGGLPPCLPAQRQTVRTDNV